MQITRLEEHNIAEVVELWYEASVKAHDFIPLKYWKDNKKAMAETYLPASETYLLLEHDNIVGFASLLDDFLAAIFIRTNMQGRGLGSHLLQYIMTIHTKIQLKVYCNNISSVSFYKRHGFRVLSEEIDKETNQKELLMEWSK